MVGLCFPFHLPPHLPLPDGSPAGEDRQGFTAGSGKVIAYPTSRSSTPLCLMRVWPPPRGVRQKSLVLLPQGSAVCLIKSEQCGASPVATRLSFTLIGSVKHGSRLRKTICFHRNQRDYSLWPFFNSVSFQGSAATILHAFCCMFIRPRTPLENSQTIISISRIAWIFAFMFEMTWESFGFFCLLLSVCFFPPFHTECADCRGMFYCFFSTITVLDCLQKYCDSFFFPTFKGHNRYGEDHEDSVGTPPTVQSKDG